MIKLFIDDERDPPTLTNEDRDGWFVVRSYNEAAVYMTENGCPDFISFDHDLGTDKTGLDIVNWIIEQDQNIFGKFIPKDFGFYVHSQNPIGAKNIRDKLNQYIEFRLAADCFPNA